MAVKITLGELAKKFATAPFKFDGVVNKELKVVGVKVRDDATKKFGQYQPAVGDLPAWAPLKPATIKAKERAGGGEDPLIGHFASSKKHRKSGWKSGSRKVWGMPLRSSIMLHVDGMVAHIGTDNPLARYHEYGAPAKNIPPRPFLRPAAFENQKFFMERMALAWEEVIKLL